ncbi:glycosyltransferase [Spiroplasma clarkii]|uniref:Glycosyltransferase n=1 Tax=Spiroplasma clarkii TaxID=2139 RepID=A0A1Y0L3H2_9MOLU|nr:glycosyltransferase family 2 protein [Spiroplasma clarkii]ARU92265.1 glycosyltransferase [Spiroplasma clarkii]ATX71578.1 glycosyltransferase [Spiroplasma clarkii]
MLLSFIIATKENTPVFEKTFQSILSQSNQDFEIILVLDRSIVENAKQNFGKDIFWEHENVKLVLNNSVQGIAASYNTAISVAEGDYIKFVNEGDTLEDNFVQTIAQNLAKYPDVNIDVLEYSGKLSGMVDVGTVTYLQLDKLYALEQEPEPLAYTNLILFNKLFRTKLLQLYNFKFQRFVRYDALFTYKVLTQTKYYLHIATDKYIEEIIIQQPDYSAFDTVNQWAHIFNYYRRMGKFKVYKDELYYAYYKSVLHIWLWTIKHYDNKVLLKKSIDFVNKKVVNKIEDFTQANKIFLQSKDAKFTEICKNYLKYLKDIQK